MRAFTGLSSAGTVPSLQRALLPYAAVPAAGALLVYVSLTPHGEAVRLGVVAGALALIGLVLLRQAMVMRALVALCARGNALGHATSQWAANARRDDGGHDLYAATDDQRGARRLALMSELRQALAHQDLRLHYQPQVSLRTGRVCGVEALLRWNHPEHGLIPPDYFIPLAEHTGLIGPLTEWVLHAALRQARAWQEQGIALGVAINLSARSLHDDTLPAQLAAALQEHAVAPGSVTLEVTESAVMADAARAQAVLTRLRATGVRLSIDDFGTGYSSLSYLKTLPVQEVKIDKSFVLGLGLGADGEAPDTAIVCAVIGLAGALGLDVVAEGVESPEAWALLEAVGCDVAQGYYMSRPLPAAELARWLHGSIWGLQESAPGPDSLGYSSAQAAWTFAERV